MTKWFRYTAILILINLSTTSAFESTLGLKGGASTYLGDIKQQKVTFYGGLSFDYWIREQFSAGLLAYSAHLQAREDDYYFETPVHSLAALLKVRPFGKYVVSPYLLGGAEGFLIDPNDGLGNPLPNKAEGKYRKFNWGFPVGGGLSVFVLENLTIDLEGMYHFTITDYIDDLEEGSGKDAFITASLGISFHFGKPKDTDGDGILDKDDLDPLRPEDFDGFEDTDGAPDLDNDKDGVPDDLDHCPNTPEDIDSFNDQDGCPDIDNDEDGIQDDLDGCPGTDETVAKGEVTKEDVDSFQDEDGCPDLDNDEDKVLDPKDQCPGTDETIAQGIDTKETWNDYEDDDGCPDKKPEIAVEKGESIVLEGVYFATGSSRLTQNSRYILDKVVRTLRDNPKIEVEIRGHTDNTGGYQLNMRLSQSRADAVKIYLINNGIDARRVRTIGYGPDKPIAPNSTREGRALNRRIEFFRIK